MTRGVRRTVAVRLAIVRQARSRDDERRFVAAWVPWRAEPSGSPVRTAARRPAAGRGPRPRGCQSAEEVGADPGRSAGPGCRTCGRSPPRRRPAVARRTRRLVPEGPVGAEGRAILSTASPSTRVVSAATASTLAAAEGARAAAGRRAHDGGSRSRRLFPMPARPSGRAGRASPPREPTRDRLEPAPVGGVASGSGPRRASAGSSPPGSTGFPKQAEPARVLDHSSEPSLELDARVDVRESSRGRVGMESSVRSCRGARGASRRRRGRR